MRIAVDLTSLAGNFSGIEQYAFRLARSFAETYHGHSFIYVFQGEVFPGLEDAVSAPHVRSHVFLPRHKSKLVVSQLDVAREFRRINADVYLFPAFPQPLLFGDRRAVSVIHDVSFWDCPQTLTRKSVLYWRAACRHAVRNQPVVTVSEFSKTRIHEVVGVPLERIVVAYDGIDRCFVEESDNEGQFTQVQHRYGLPDEYVLSLCTLEPRKNLPFLIEAWVRACETTDSGPDLVLAGRRGWKVDKLLSSVPEHLQDRVHLTGFVANEDLPSLYRHCRCFVFPSLYEGFGVPPVEALAAGARVFCSDIEVLHETCGDDAEYFRLDDTTELARMLAQCESSVGHVRSRPRICERFDWDVTAATLLRALENDSCEGVAVV